MNQKEKNRAKKIFEESDIEKLYMNNKGHFFTSQNLALNSVKQVSEVKEVTRSMVIVSKTTPKQPKRKGKKLLIETVENGKLCFIEKLEGETPIEGDKAVIGKAAAEGVIKINPQLSYEFKEGALVKIIVID